MTLTRRALAYARRYPGQSATQIANALRARPCSVSSILARAVKAGKLSRSEAVHAPCNTGNFWRVRDGGGPGGGHVYGPVHS